MIMTLIPLNLPVLGLAAMLCLAGTWIGMRNYSRARVSSGSARHGWLFMAAVGVGGALWSAIYLSVIAVDHGLDVRFSLGTTSLSMFVIIANCFVGLTVASWPRAKFAPELGGLIIGLGMVTMLFTVLANRHVPANMIYEMTWLVGAIFAGAIFGALAINRSNRPVTRWCQHGAAISFTIGLIVMTALAAAAIQVSAQEIILPPVDSRDALGVATRVLSNGALLIAISFAFHTIDNRQRAELDERLKQNMVIDTMTGLPNRFSFNEKLTLKLGRARELATHVVILNIDIDRFNAFNDVHGQQAGDELLCAAAQRMCDILRHGEFLARHNGDKFMAIKMPIYTEAETIEFAERLQRAIEKPFDIAGRQIRLTLSIGMAISSNSNSDREILIAHAKFAMQRAKAKGGNTICLFQPSMAEVERRRQILTNDLENATSLNQMELHFQIQQSLEDSSVSGFEALLRWNHPKYGNVRPDEFIPLAEETGLIAPIGLWVLRRACETAMTWDAPYRVAVNLSPKQIETGNLVEDIHIVLLETGLPPSRLEIEITESMLMSNTENALAVLRRLKSMGIVVSLDDFGAGYSSLGMLHAFPFDKIKLDRSFVARAPHDQAAVAIVRAVIALGRSLNVPVLAEGIETQAQRDFLHHEGCNEIQGYLIGKPVPNSELPCVILALDAACSMHPKLAGLHLPDSTGTASNVRALAPPRQAIA